MALLAAGVGQTVGFASRELGRTIGEVQFPDALAHHGTDEPPSSTPQMKRGRSHRDGEAYRCSVHGVPQGEIASLRRPDIDLILDRCDDLGAAPPLSRSGNR